MSANRPAMTADEARTFSRYSPVNAAIVASALPCGCVPYVDVFTFNRWRAQGRTVRKGERAVRISTYAPVTDKDTGEVIGRRPWRDRSIYRDDDDAETALLARIQTLSAERDRIRAYNASCRKGAPDVSLLDAGQQADLLTIARVASYSIGKRGEMPSYALTNLSANIRRQVERLEGLIRDGERA